MTSAIADDSPEEWSGAATRLRAALATGRDRLVGLREDVRGLARHLSSHGGQYTRRLLDADTPSSRRMVLREVGLAEAPKRVAAQVGETCERPRTSDAALPWRTADWYGGWGGAAYWETEPGTTRPPVVFVHGNGGDACNFDALADHLRSRGWTGDELWAITFGQFTPDHDEMRAQLDDFVGHVLAETGAPQIDVVAHSLGVTGVRYWLDRNDRYADVARFVGLGGANHGVCGCPGCEDATPEADGLAGARSACREVAPACFDDPDHPLAGLNDGDETPGDVEYVMVRGRLDPLFWCERRSPYLDGARNRAVATGHLGLLEQSAVVRRALERR